MSEQLDYMELAQRAQQGDKGALDRLAELASDRLRTYVYRLTLQEDLTSEIVQETLLEMCRVIGNLKHTDRFLPWLYGIATNKLRHFYRSEQTMRRATTSKSDMEQGRMAQHEGLENLVSQELRDIISEAIKGLKTNHRAVLIMRCYDGLSYAEIAESMGATEFGTRMLFLRAKKALQKQLAKQGLKKGTLLGALVLFGKMTAPSKVAAAELSISTTTLNAGLAAGVATAAASKAAVVTMAAGALTVGTAVHLQDNTPLDEPTPVVSTWGASDAYHARKPMEKHYYYLPEDISGPIFVRSQAGVGAQTPDRVVLQNGKANYVADGSTVYVKNARWYSPDLRVMRLPFDSAQLRESLDRSEGIQTNVPDTDIKVRGRGAFVSTIRVGEDFQIRPVVYSSTVPEEDLFLADWPYEASVVDQRDSIHECGYAYMRIRGRLHGETVKGHGFVPLVHDRCRSKQPWLELQVGSTRIADTKHGAWMSKDGEGVHYPAGSFFAGLLRPWDGLHVLDTVRRDAAKDGYRFKTQLITDEEAAEITVFMDDYTVVYNVDLDDDLLNQITIQDENRTIGEFVFDYTDGIDRNVSSLRFTKPRITDSKQAGPGFSWFLELVESH